MLSRVVLNALIKINACHYARAHAHSAHTHAQSLMQHDCFTAV